MHFFLYKVWYQKKLTTREIIRILMTVVSSHGVPKAKTVSLSAPQGACWKMAWPEFSFCKSLLLCVMFLSLGLLTLSVWNTSTYTHRFKMSPTPAGTWAEKAWVYNLLLPVQHLKIPRLSPELTASFFLLLPFPDSSFSNFTAEETPAVFLWILWVFEAEKRWLFSLSL